MGNRDWREMISHLPTYLVRTESELFAPLPDFVSITKDVQEVSMVEDDEQLCLICMTELANTVLLPCGHVRQVHCFEG